MLSVRVLGPMALELDGRELPAPRAAAGRWLLAWLALNPGPQPRAGLAARFWPDVLDESARQSLRNGLYGLRRDLGPAAGVLLAGGETVELSADVRVDARELDAALAAGDAEAAAELAERGELLWGFDEEWALQARDERRDRLGALLAERIAAAADPQEAVAWARRRHRAEPLSEDAARGLMAALADAGDRAAALAVYERLRDRLRRELRVAPSPATRELEARLREPPDDAPVPAPAPAAGSTTHPALSRALPLTGRGAELAALVGAWAQARAGSGGIAIVEGEAGMGKTRLVAELAARAGADGARVALGAGVALEASAPLAPWAELFDTMLAGLDTAGAPWRPQLVRLVPRLAPVPEAPAELDRLGLHEAAVAAVAAAADAWPLLLVLEDAHLADAASLALLAHLGRRLHDRRVLLVITRRPSGSTALAATEDHLTAGGAVRGHIGLAPLHSADARALVAAAQAGLDRDAVGRAVAAAEGNPLLAVETARALGRGHTGPPPSLLAVVRGLLRGLSPDARRLADLLAVAGRALEAAEQDALPVPDPALAAAEGVTTGLLEGGDGPLDYRHALLRDAAYAAIEPPRRRRLHEKLADALIAAGERQPAEIARHLRHAGRDELAVDHLARAARAARDVAALAEARAFVSEALELRPEDPQLWLLLAHIDALRGRHDDMVDASRAALERIPATDVRARGLALLERGLWLSSALCWPQDALADFREAARLLKDESGVDAAMGRLCAASAWAEAVAGDPDRVDPLLERAEQLSGGHLTAVHSISARVNALVRQDRAAEALDLAGDLDVAIGAGATELRLADTVWLEFATAAAFIGEHERALGFVQRFLSVSGALPPKRIEGLAALAYVLVRLDRPQEAVAAAEEMIMVAEQIGDAELPAVARHDLGTVLCQVGEHTRGEALIARALADGAKVSVAAARLRRAESLVALGRLEEAEGELRAAVLSPLRPADQPQTLVPRVARIQALVARARGDDAEALRRFDEAIAAWRRLRGDDRRAAYMSNLVDLGRPPVAGLTEPARELDRVLGEREELEACRPSTTAP
jgi:DNA-binding SARP family transcriptional activator